MTFYYNAIASVLLKTSLKSIFYHWPQLLIKGFVKTPKFNTVSNCYIVTT